MGPLISVSLCTYNGARFLEEQLFSLAEQSRLPFELVVFDDISSDKTWDILSRFASAAPFPVKLFQNPRRLGYRDNFMKAAEACSGDWIAFCDQDDVWHRDKIDVLYRTACEVKSLLIYHNSDIIFDNQSGVETFYERDIPSGIIPPLTRTPFSFPFGFSMMFRRELLRYSYLRNLTIDMYDISQNLAHDQWIFFLSSCLGQVYYINDILTGYRQHGENLFGVSRQKISPMKAFLTKFTLFHRYDYVLAMSKSMSIVLREILDLEIGAEDCALAARAAIWYEDMAEAYQYRLKTYQSLNIISRAKSWLKLIESGRYGSKRPITFANKGMFRDFFWGVLLSSLKKPSAKITAHDGSLRVRSV